MRVKRDGGFFLCFLVNLVFRAEWLLFAVVALTLNISFDIPPIIVFWILIGLWIVISLLLTLIFSYTSEVASKRNPTRENQNPYSKRTEEYLSNKRSTADYEK